MVRVVAVTVTYGERFEKLCRETIERAFAAGVEEVVVVDNGSEPRSAHALQDFARARNGITAIRNEENLGSAQAFGAGLARALDSQADFIWLLDDDNWVDPEVLTTLLSAQAEESAIHGDDDVVVCARRVPNAFHEHLYKGAAAEEVYPPIGSFLSFDGLTYVWRRLGWLSNSPGSEHLRIPYAPYGGLLLRPSIVEEVGLPDSTLVLYSDDTVWTSRIVALGHPILLVLSAVIEDADGKWIKESAHNSISSSIQSPRLDRLYLSTRNRVWFDYSRLTTATTRFRYSINRAIVMTVAVVGMMRASSREGFRVFHRAVKDAERGDLTRFVRLTHRT